MFAGVDAAADAELLTGKLKDVVAFGGGFGDRLAARARRRACGDALLGICRPLGPAGGSKLSSDADRISSLRCCVTGEQLGVLQLLPDCWTPRL